MRFVIHYNFVQLVTLCMPVSVIDSGMRICNLLTVNQNQPINSEINFFIILNYTRVISEQLGSQTNGVRMIFCKFIQVSHWARNMVRLLAIPLNTGMVDVGSFQHLKFCNRDIQILVFSQTNMFFNYSRL